MNAVPPPVDRWQPVDVDAIQPLLGDFDGWCLCGGRSLDWLLGRTTRPHGDTDIGVLRSRLVECLGTVGDGRVWLCDPPGAFTAWDGGAVPGHVHDIWITDGGRRHWVLQVMAYDEDGDQVVFRRDRRLRWPRQAHVLTVRGVPVLNPVVTLLFKLHKDRLEDKDVLDMRVLIEELARRHDPS